MFIEAEAKAEAEAKDTNFSLSFTMVTANWISAANSR